jgi:hypothetical protein
MLQASPVTYCAAVHLKNREVIVPLSDATRQGKLARLAPAAAFVFLSILRTPPTAAADLDEASLGALSLQTAHRLVQQRNRDVRAAQRALEAAEAGILTAGARQNPNLSLQTSNINPHEGIGAGSLKVRRRSVRWRSWSSAD